MDIVQPSKSLELPRAISVFGEEAGENLEKMPRLQHVNRGTKAAWPHLGQDLMAWITEKQNNGLVILPAVIRLKAIELSKHPQYDVAAGEFKASNH